MKNYNLPLKEYWDKMSVPISQHHIDKPYDLDYLLLLAEIINNEDIVEILEVGCSCGMNLIWLDKKTEASYFGVDLSDTAVQIGVKRFPHIGMAQMDLIKDEPLRHKFGLVFSRATLQHIPPQEIEQVFKKVCSMSSNKLVVYEASGKPFGKVPDSRATFRHDYERLIPENGFEIQYKQGKAWVCRRM